LRALVFEPNSSPHHVQGAVRLARCLTGTASHVTLALSQAATLTPLWQDHLAAECRGAAVDPWIAGVSRGKPLLPHDQLRCLRQSIARARAEHAYVPAADAVAQWMGLMVALTGRHGAEGIPLEGLCRSGLGGHFSSWRRRVRHSLVKRAGFARLFCLDPFVPDWERMAGVPPSDRARVLPEPVAMASLPPKRDARRRLGVPEDGRYLGLLGAPEMPRGAPLVVEAFMSATLASADRLLVFGLDSESLRATSRRLPASWLRGDRVLLRDASSLGNDLTLGFAAVDLVAVPSHGPAWSAGLIARAVAAERPVIGPRGGWPGKMIEEFSLGWEVADLSVAAIAGALPAALDATNEWKLGSAGGRLRRFHTEENHALCWSELLRERSGQRAWARATTWDSVVAPSGREDA
jgi:hypothetical protein